MRKLSIYIICLGLLALTTTTVFANPISDLSRDKVEQDCKESLLKEWGNNYSLIKTLLESNLSSYDYMASQPSSEVSDGIMKRLLNEWYPSMNLIQILYMNDMAAYRELSK